jgi:hypothetical protein
MSEFASEIEKTDIVNRWISTFASNVSDKILREHVLEDCNYLWHVFSWGKVPCLEGAQARRAFDERESDLVYMFRKGRSIDKFPRIEGLIITNKVTSEQLETIDDIYVVDLNFIWTYVHTHESECGPYFAVSNRL